MIPGHEQSLQPIQPCRVIDRVTVGIGRLVEHETGNAIVEQCRPQRAEPAKGMAEHDRWPLERFRVVAHYLERRMPVYWCAGPEEALPEAVRFPDLRGPARWLAAARVYVGNDSGISHLAAACGVPCVVLFGPTDPRIWAPRGRVCVLPFETPPQDAAEAALGFAR